MDLKDVIQNVQQNVLEASTAYHAGHHDVAEQHLRRLSLAVDQYFRESPTPAEDVTKSATSEKPDEESQEKPAEVPGAALPATQFAPGAAAQQVGGSLTDEKPTQ